MYPVDPIRMLRVQRKRMCRFGIYLICVLSLSVGPLARAQDSVVDSLLRLSIGGEAAVTQAELQTTYWAEGHGTMNGQPVTYTLAYAAPNRIYSQLRMGPIVITQAYDGATAWQRDMNGTVAKLSGFEEFELLKQVYFQSYSYLFDDRLPGSREYAGLDVVDQDTLHKIIIVPFDRDTVWAYLNKETAYPELMISKLDNIETRVYVSDYREADGIVLPFASRAVVVGAPIQIELLVDSIIVNESKL